MKLMHAQYKNLIKIAKQGDITMGSVSTLDLVKVASLNQEFTMFIEKLENVCVQFK